jgi:hypothetical protein
MTSLLTSSLFVAGGLALCLWLYLGLPTSEDAGAVRASRRMPR